MTVTYRNDLDRPLTSLEVDTNFKTLSDRMDQVEFSIPEPAVVDEAPLDGKQYARQNAGWSVVVTPSAPAGFQHAASDGAFYGSKGGGWVSFVPGIADAPNDGQAYNRKNGSWVVAASGGTGGGGGGGTGNLRHIGTWAQSLNIEKHDIVEYDGMLWLARETFFKDAPNPSFSNDGYWRSLGFPSSDTTASATSRIRHTFSTTHRTDQKTVSVILDSFETRLKAAEDKLANHEARIAALEAR